MQIHDLQCDLMCKRMTIWYNIMFRILYDCINNATLPIKTYKIFFRTIVAILFNCHNTHSVICHASQNQTEKIYTNKIGGTKWNQHAFLLCAFFFSFCFSFINLISKLNKRIGSYTLVMATDQILFYLLLFLVLFSSNCYGWSFNLALFLTTDASAGVVACATPIDIFVFI